VPPADGGALTLVMVVSPLGLLVEPLVLLQCALVKLMKSVCPWRCSPWWMCHNLWRGQRPKANRPGLNLCFLAAATVAAAGTPAFLLRNFEKHTYKFTLFFPTDKALAQVQAQGQLRQGPHVQHPGAAHGAHHVSTPSSSRGSRGAKVRAPPKTPAPVPLQE